MKKHVYFIKPVGAAGPIKIGCSMYVKERLATLALWSPAPLEVIYEEEGGHDIERKLHKCFADLHSHHEWFHPGERLIQALSKLKSGMKISEAVDLSDNRGSIHSAHGKGSRPESDVRKGHRSYKCRIRHAVNRAQKITKSRRFSPRDIEQIMSRWDGVTGYKMPANPIRPTPKEFARLDEFLSDPVRHCITYAQLGRAA